MFETEKYFIDKFLKHPTKRIFMLFIRLIFIEVTCLILTGHCLDELDQKYV